MRRVRIHGVELKYLGESSYEFEFAGSDFHVRKEGSRWRLDEFDSSVEDANEAWRFADDFPTLRAAVGFVVGADMQ